MSVHLRIEEGRVCCPCGRPGALRMPVSEAATFRQLRCAGCGTTWAPPAAPPPRPSAWWTSPKGNADG